MFEKLAYAEGAAGAAQAQPNPILSFFPLILIFVIFYFFLIRPQQQRQKEHKKMVDELKKGDRVVTAGGILGTITSIQNDYVVLKIGDSDNTKIEIMKSSVSGLKTDKK